MVKTAETVGDGVVEGTKVVGSGVAAVGTGVVTATEAVGNAAAAVGSATADAVNSTVEVGRQPAGRIQRCYQLSCKGDLEFREGEAAVGDQAGEADGAAHRQGGGHARRDRCQVQDHLRGASLAQPRPGRSQGSAWGRGACPLIYRGTLVGCSGAGASGREQEGEQEPGQRLLLDRALPLFPGGG